MLEEFGSVVEISRGMRGRRGKGSADRVGDMNAAAERRVDRGLHIWVVNHG